MVEIIFFNFKNLAKLDVHEFGLMLKRIDKNLADDDIEIAFQKFD